METFSNIQTFANNYSKDARSPKSIINLLLFTSCSNINRMVITKTFFRGIITTVKNSDSVYLFNYNDKAYPFSIFSDSKLQTFDKKILQNVFKRTEESLFRTLKLACSMDLVNPRIVIGNSISTLFNTIILFQENGKDKVIDYTSNLIMNKEDYYEVFNFEELNVLSKLDLYRIYYFINTFQDDNHIFEYLIFTKEIFTELSQKEQFSFLFQKYNNLGYNLNNDVFWGNDCDCLFFQDIDTYNTKFEKLKKELEDFKNNPSKKFKHFTYNSKKDECELKAANFGHLKFEFLQNLEKEQIEELRSCEMCHDNAYIVMNCLLHEDVTSAYIVGGKLKVNEIDYYYHSWVEVYLNGKYEVWDYNRNIIMDRDAYYKLFEAVAISKTPIMEMQDIVQNIIYDWGFKFTPMDLNYFGTEIMQDLKKNEQILNKKI